MKRLGQTPGWMPALAVLGLVGAVLTAGTAGLIAGAPAGAGSVWGDAYLGAVLRFTVMQAALSALISVGLAIPVARALARRPRFAGRSVLIRLMALPMVIPNIVAVLGIVIVLGRSGWLADLWQGLSLPGRIDIYGLTGILIAHVFYNLPLAVRLLLGGWAGIPANSWRLASQLGMTGGQTFRLIEWPMIREIAPGILGIVFLLCFTSFAIVLALGGGPPNATLEVAIYQALRLDYDLSRAVTLAGLQIALCAGIFAAVTLASRPVPISLDITSVVTRADAAPLIARLIDTASIVAATILILVPLAALLIAGLSGPLASVLSSGDVWAAALRSLVVGLSAGLLACLLAGGLIAPLRRLRPGPSQRWLGAAVETVGSVVLVVPPLALGAGLFILMRGIVNPFDAALPIVAVVNALMGMPFALRILGPPARQITARHGRLMASVGMGRWARWRLVDWPLMRRPLALALGLTTALSFGDLGVIALVGSQQTVTLPLLLYQRMGAYRMDEAAVIGLLLIGLALLVFFIIDRGIGGRERD